MRRAFCAMGAACVLAYVGCTGHLQQNPAGSTAGPNDAGSAEGDDEDSDGLSAGKGDMGETVLHRLNRVELRNTLRDLFGPEVAKDIDASGDPRVLGFDSVADVLTVSQSSVDAFFSLSEQVASRVSLESLGGCDGRGERECLQRRFETLAPRMLRRPISDAEQASYLTLWDDVQRRQGADAASRAVIQRLLLTPDFLYHVEVGNPDTGRLTPYELASRISYFAWETMPDTELFSAAANGQLETHDQVAQQLARMLKSPSGLAMQQRFFSLWADLEKLDGLTKDPELYPGFDVLREPMRAEFQSFVSDLLANDGTVTDLLKSTRSFADEVLASHYGSTPRPGFLAQGAFLSIHGKAGRSSPILRGVFIRERLLCAPLPPPPAGASNNLPDMARDSTTREYVTTLTEPEKCKGCHAQINPIGFALEGFDGVGQARTAENGQMVDTTGAVTAGDAAGDVSGASELVTRLAGSKTVRGCLARHWFRSRFRRAEQPGDARIIAELTEALTIGGDRLSSLAQAVANIDAFYLPHYRVARASEAP